jgi:hypothetical protein
MTTFRCIYCGQEGSPKWYGRHTCEVPTQKQEGGDHYKTMPIQPVEYIHKNGIGFLEGCAIKYLSRHKSKGKADDIRKAIHFCELILEMVYGEKR